MLCKDKKKFGKHKTPIRIFLIFPKNYREGKNFFGEQISPYEEGKIFFGEGIISLRQTKKIFPSEHSVAMLAMKMFFPSRAAGEQHYRLRFRQREEAQ
ncbi:MAG: hypothetical protein J6T94_04425 [Bacteroidaceae bacterium]|nr:hypothetical protein [Bacteroidaceae bacterium]